MIRFHELSGNAEPPELPKAEVPGISNGKAEIAKEAASFWDDIFEEMAGSQDVQCIEEDRLLAEIFGRCEDEFHFDFEIDEDIQNILDKFDSNHWEQLSDEKRIDAVKEFADVLSQKLGLDTPPEIRFYEGAEGDCGAYNPDDHSVNLNHRYLSNPEEMVNTVPHELRHAYQHQRSENLETKTDMLYLVNFNNYISPQRLADGKYLFFTDYQDQFVEAEARAFANLFTREVQ